MGENKKLKWTNHSQSILSELRSFRNKELFCDCTIICEGKHFPVHRLVLSSCSDYFKQLFSKTQCCHPFIIINDIHHEDLEILLNYMYEGYSVVLLEKLSLVIKEGQSLNIKGFEHPTQLVSTAMKPQSPSETSYVTNPDDESDYETLRKKPDVLLQKPNDQNIKKRKEVIELEASNKKFKTDDSIKQTDILRMESLSRSEHCQGVSMAEQKIKSEDSTVKHDDTLSLDGFDTSQEVSTTEVDMHDFRSILHDSEVNPSILPDLSLLDIEVKEEIEMFNNDLDGVHSSLEAQENIEENQCMEGSLESLPSTSQQCLDVSNSSTGKPYSIPSEETNFEMILPKNVKSTSSSNVCDRTVECHPSSQRLKKKENLTSAPSSRRRLQINGYKKKGGTKCLYDFKLEIVDSTLGKYKEFSRIQHDENNAQGTSAQFRLKGRHFPKYGPGKTSHQCVVCSVRKARKRVVYSCEQCNVYLCIDPCFKIYHTFENLANQPESV